MTATPPSHDLVLALLAARGGTQPAPEDIVEARWIQTPESYPAGTHVVQAVALGVSSILYSRRGQGDLIEEDTFIVVRRGAHAGPRRTRPATTASAPLAPAVAAWFRHPGRNVAWEPVEIYHIPRRATPALVAAWWSSLAPATLPQHIPTPATFTPPVAGQPSRWWWLLLVVPLGILIGAAWVVAGLPPDARETKLPPDVLHFMIGTLLFPLWLVLFCQLPFMRDPDARPRGLDDIGSTSASPELAYMVTALPAVIVLIALSHVSPAGQKILGKPLGSNLMTALVLLSLGAALAVVWAGVQAAFKRLRRRRRKPSPTVRGTL